MLAAMAEHRLCPWWLGYFLICPARRWMQKPGAILAPYVRAGMTVVEPGPGMGFFTLELARLAGASGRVIVVDVQPAMLERLSRRAQTAGLAGRIETRLAQPESLGLKDVAGSADFVLAFAVVHEMPSVPAFFQQAAQVLKPGGHLLLAEPAGHVTPAQFDAELAAAAEAGLGLAGRPAIRRSHTALLQARA
jgi:ubiquinone/menaquinone biosynthesis C-methylase UbiE